MLKFWLNNIGTYTKAPFLYTDLNSFNYFWFPGSLVSEVEQAQILKWILWKCISKYEDIILDEIPHRSLHAL